MSNEHTPRDTQKDDAMFAELMKQARRHEDVGIAEFETHAIEAIDRLKEEYISVDTSITDLDDSEDSVYEDDLEEATADALTDLVGEWMHGGDRVTVTGHLYVTDVFMGTFKAPEEWGERIEDENDPGSYYYAVQDVELRSAGIEIVPQYDLDTSALINLKGVYEFAMPDDEEGRIVVFAGIGDLVAHTYEMPSPQEAISYLELNYPDECVLISKATTADGQTTLPERLRVLVSQLQDRFAESDMFVKSVEQYVGHLLNFSPQESHSLVIRDKFNLFAGSSIVVQGDQEVLWPEYSLDRPFFIQEANRPTVHFKKQTDGSVDCYIEILRYNDEKGTEDPEYVRVMLDSIESFRSNRASYPILSLLKDEGMGLVDVGPEIFAAEDDYDTGTVEVHAIEDKLSATERLIQGLESFEEELKNVIEKLSRARKRLYDTREEASSASVEFINEEMKDLFSLYESDIRYAATLSGDGVLRVNVNKDITSASEEVSGIYNLNIAFNSDEEALISLAPGQSVNGMLRGPFAGIERVDDGLYETEKYRISPALIFNEPVDHNILTMVNGVELLSAQLVYGTFVKLEGNAEIAIPVLDHYRETQLRIDTLAQVESLAPVLDLMNELQDTIIKAIPRHDYVAFDRIELFPLLDTLMKDEELDSEITTSAMDALESLIVNRYVKIGGEMFVKNLDDGRYIPVTIGVGDASLNGQVIDVRNDIEGDDLYIVLQDQIEDTLVYVRAKTITELHF